MHDDNVLEISSVSKKFSRSLKRVMLYGATDIVTDFLKIPTDSSILRPGEFKALNEVTFSVKKGESVALIGANGSGKSTLLKVINGILMPDHGKISIKGRVGALIEVGAGFHPMLTGRENVYVNGAILGMTRKEIDKNFDSIVEFSGIADFIDSPVKHYSSGMYVRLGFSVAVHCDPDILLVDEVLSVGDYAFSMKCMEKMKEFKRKGVSIIFVSHSESAVRSICEKTVLLDHGEQLFMGETNEAFEKYHHVSNEQMKKDIIATHDNIMGKALETSTRRGTGTVRFTEIAILDGLRKPVSQIPFGTKKIIIKAKYKAIEKIVKPRFWAYLRDAKKTEHIVVCGGTTTALYPIECLEIGYGEVEFSIDTTYLSPGLYGIYCGIADSVIFDGAFDVWDINGLFLEVTASDLYPNDESRISPPYFSVPFGFTLSQK